MTERAERVERVEAREVESVTARSAAGPDAASVPQTRGAAATTRVAAPGPRRRRRAGRPMKGLVIAACAVVLFAAAGDNAFARGGFRGGGFHVSRGFSSFGGRRSFAGRSGSIFGWGSATRRSSAGRISRTGRAANTATAIGGSRASAGRARNLYSSARRNGTVFGSRQEAASAFRAKYSGKYSSRFASRPATRPSYIPRTTTINGRAVNVGYNSTYGGYGYMSPTLGHWVFFNAMANAAIMNSLMAGSYYWWGRPPVYASAGAGFFTWALLIFFAFMVFSFLLRLFRSRGQW